MSKTMQIILFSFFLALFMHSKVSINGVQDDDLKPYLTEFVRIAKLFNKDLTSRARTLTLQFAETDPNEYANCNYTTNTITVSKVDWVMISIANREELLAHEFGHCLLGLDHYGDGIMKALNLLGTREYTLNYTHYINELFSRQPGTYIDIVFEEGKYD